MQRITLTLHDEALDHPMTIDVDPLDPVASLQDHIQDGGSRILIYNGCILNRAFTFAYFGIVDGAQLYFMRCPRPVKQQRHQKARKQRASAMLKREKSRLVDLCMTRIESNSLRSRKLFQKFEEVLERPDLTVSSRNSIVHIDAEKPSTEMLPVPWQVGAE